jgi:ATP adenylyltransferase
MDCLWAPWRIQFIEDQHDKRDNGCIFCSIASQGDDRERLVLYRGKTCYAVMNRFPYNCAHLLVIPYRHEGELKNLGREEYAEMLDIGSKSMEIIKAEIDAEGFNCGFNFGKVAGAGILDHVHFHVVPRWCGDTNFFPVIGDIRSMPEYLQATYDRLNKGFKKIAGS